MDNKPQLIQKIYWGYDIFKTFIQCEPNIDFFFHLNR